MLTITIAVLMEVLDQNVIFHVVRKILKFDPDSIEYVLGTFVPYDASYDYKTPEVDGFQAGISLKDNITKQFVGYGSSCGDQDPVPCSIETNKTNRGCYISCGDKGAFDNQTAFYLLAHSKLTWTKTDVRRMPTVSNTLKVFTGGLSMMFGRVFYEGNYRVGKVYIQTKTGRDGLYLTTSKGEIFLRSKFEILSCSSNLELPCGNHLYFI